MSNEQNSKVENVITDNEVIEDNQDTKPSFDYKKEREERIKNRVEKAFFNELGVKSIEEIKEALKSIPELKKQVDEGKLNHCKLQTLKAGIDDEFVDFVVDKLNKQVTRRIRQGVK